MQFMWLFNKDIRHDLIQGLNWCELVGIFFLQVNLCVALTPRILALLVLGANSKGGYSGGYSGGGLAAAATRLWQGLGSMDALAGFNLFWGTCFQLFLLFLLFPSECALLTKFLVFFIFWINFAKLCCTGGFGSSSLADVFAGLDCVLPWNSQNIKGFSGQQPLAAHETLVVTGVVTNRAAYAS